MSYVTKTCLLVSSSVSSKQLLRFVHGQGQKREQQHTIMNFVEFYNHSPVSTMFKLWTKLISFVNDKQSRRFCVEITGPQEMFWLSAQITKRWRTFVLKRRSINFPCFIAYAARRGGGRGVLSDSCVLRSVLNPDPIQGSNPKNDTLFQEGTKTKNGVIGSSLFCFCNIGKLRIVQFSQIICFPFSYA